VVFENIVVNHQHTALSQALRGFFSFATLCLLGLGLGLGLGHPWVDFAKRLYLE
jgi:hypothetical protein